MLRVATSADLPPPLRHLRKDAPKTIAATAAPPLKIAFPPDGARIDLGLEGGGREETLALKALGGALPLTWFVNGAPIGRTRPAPPIRLDARRRRLRARFGDRRQGRLGFDPGAAGVKGIAAGDRPKRPRRIGASSYRATGARQAALRRFFWPIILRASNSGTAGLK